MSDLAPLNPREPGLPDEAPSQASKIGDRLRQARERRGVTIAEASATLKIRAPILEAFEREDHSQLPPRVYALGQLRTYAAYLGLDPATVAAGGRGRPFTKVRPHPCDRNRRPLQWSDSSPYGQASFALREDCWRWVGWALPCC